MSKRYFIAVFESEDDVKAAVRSARRHDYVVEDVYTPYAVHGLDEAMGLRPSRLSWACLAFAIAGTSLGLWLQHWTSTTDWPLNVGGKPFNSLPAFIPVTFELAVLFAGLGTVAALFARALLFPGKKPFLPESRVTDDQFAMLLAQTDAAFDPAEVCRLMEAHHPAWCGELIDGHLHRLGGQQPDDQEGLQETLEEKTELHGHLSPSRVRRHKRTTVGAGSK